MYKRQEVSCRVEVTFPADEVGVFSDTETRSFEGKSMITLSENATADEDIKPTIYSDMKFINTETMTLDLSLIHI